LTQHIRKDEVQEYVSSMLTI